MLDPRDVIEADPFDNVSSDGDEELQLEREIKEMDRRKKDLQERLKRKKQESLKMDPNFKGVQIPESPKKEEKVELSLKKVTPRELTFNPDENENELGLQAKYSTSNSSNDQRTDGTTSYFIDKFQSSKRRENIAIQRQEEMISARVHTFQTTGLQTNYTPISTDEQETYSGLWISKRYVPNKELDKLMQDIKILRLNKLFAKIKPPKFNEPQYPNWAVIGIIASKTEVKFTNSSKPQKYIKFTLTNFNQNIDLYIFGKDGVERYYNLRVGDIIAVLNPEVLPWRPSGQGNFIKSFNLRVSHNFKCILEVGRSRDLGFCAVMNKLQNKRCGAPVNKSKDRCCEYHLEAQMRNSNSKRLDLNGQYAMGAPTKTSTQPSLYRHITQDSKHNKFTIQPGWSHRNPEKEDRYGGKSRFFTNQNAAKAFFDDQFHNPDMLENLNNKRRKISDDRRDNRLERKLNQALNKDNKHTKEEYKRMKETTQSALGTGVLQRLGFDPTHGKISAVLKEGSNDSQKRSQTFKKDQVVSELMNFTKKDVVLTASKTEKLKKKMHREKVWQEHFGKQIKDLETDSDSDLDII